MILEKFWTDTRFHETIPNFDHYATTCKLRMKQGLEGQTRPQRQADFTDSPNV
jgi:hypothetical protein